MKIQDSKCWLGVPQTQQPCNAADNIKVPDPQSESVCRLISRTESVILFCGDAAWCSVAYTLTAPPLVQRQRHSTRSRIPGERLNRSFPCAPRFHERVLSGPQSLSQSRNNQQQPRGADETSDGESWERGQNSGQQQQQ